MLYPTPDSIFARSDEMRQRISFNQDWRFQKGDLISDKAPETVLRVQGWYWKSGHDIGALTEDVSSASWKEALDLDDVFDVPDGFIWFRATLLLPSPLDITPLALKFSEIADNATLYLNGQRLLPRPSWNQPFEVPLNEVWKVGHPNELAVLVETTSERRGIGSVVLQKSSVPVTATVDFNDREWRKLDLPHDWGIEGSFQQELPGETGKLPWSGVGWYRKRFMVSADDQEHRYFLEIDGAMSYSNVWLNGHFIGGWPYGYSSYQLDLTPYIKTGGENVLAIRLDNPPDSSRWYPGGGIYRNLWLTKTGPVHITQWGTQVTTTVQNNRGIVEIATTLENQSPEPQAVHLISLLLDANDQPVTSSSTQVVLQPGQLQVSREQLALQSPRLWSLQEPHLYTLVSQIVQGDKLLDRYSTPVGVRSIEWSAHQGFLLNGTRIPLHGVCLHHDLGALGVAINTRAICRQLEILQEMGCNAIRTSHNPPAPELLDLCDRMGILVIDEFSDTWKAAKTINGYARLFNNWAEKDLRALIRRDRNHPCIVAWSSGNEVAEQDSEEGCSISRFLTDIVRAEDPTRPVTSGNNSWQAGYNGFQKTNDVFGYNYKPHEYAKFHAANPEIPLYGSETASTISSRGEYFFPVADELGAGRSDFQISSYDLYAPGWAMPPDHEFKGQDQNPFVIGEFVWTGFDYLGEPTPYSTDSTTILNYRTPEERAKAEIELQELGKIRVPSRSSYFGIIDLAGFKKDRFYLYQARWRPEFPMTHILPHWNWPERIGHVTPVHVYTSGDEAELFLNGKSLGRRVRGPYEYRLCWNDVVYEPGELRVVALKNGRMWAEDVVKTTGAATQIILKSDRNTINADGKDLSFVTVCIADNNGFTVPRAKNLLRFEISGPGEIVATDNGDATDHTSFQSKERNAYNSLALVIIRTKAGQSGAITLRALSDGLRACQIIIESQEKREPKVSH